jgi:hypothetical protein
VNGWGIMYFPSNNQYHGQWNEDKMHGYGEYFWSNGRIYKGYWKFDNKDGLGIHYWGSPERAYLGFWKNNKQEGVGCIFTNKTIKYGFWDRGEKIKNFSNHFAALKKCSNGNIDINLDNFFPKNLMEAVEILKKMR